MFKNCVKIYTSEVQELLKISNVFSIRRGIYSGDVPYDEYIKGLYNIGEDNIQFSFTNVNSILAVQPNVKWGPSKKLLTNSYLQLEELTSLIETLPYFKVQEKIIMSTLNLTTKTIFGKVKLEEITQKLKSNTDIKAIVLGVSVLRSLQRITLEKLWGKPVLDRYNIVIQIFKHFAKTKEAKLQIALAEIPYIKSKLNESKLDKHSPSIISFTPNIIANDTDYQTTKDCKPWHERKEQLNMKEDKIKREIEQLKKIKEQKRALFNASLPNPYPIIAVVGYTNSGKTSLIKALTGDERIEPQNRLFATLDVSLHQGTLPFMEKVLYLDTIGFISDIPTSLINAFQATLQDINRADVIIHIRDCSHPDMEAQNETVKKTLKVLDLKTELSENTIEVYNKTDLLHGDAIDNYNDRHDIIPISITNYRGLDRLTQRIHQVLLAKADKRFLNLTVPMRYYSKVLGFLLKMNASIQSTLPSDDSNNMILKTVVDAKTLSIFQHNFGPDYIDNQSL